MSFDPFNEEFDDPMTQIENVLDEVPRDARSGFPSLDLQHEGRQTIINNFTSIISKINREPGHLKKFFSSQLGAKTKIRGKQLIIDAQLSRSQLTKVTTEYAEKYIICPNCGKPDTIIKGKKKQELRCLACGTTTKL